MEGGNLSAFPLGAALGGSETPRCHLTIPLLVNPRGDSTGSRAPVFPSRAEVTCWERLPGPPAGLSGSSRLLGFPLNPPPRVPRGFSHLFPAPADFHPNPPGHSASLQPRESSHFLLSFLFLCHNFLGSSSTLNQRGGESILSTGIVKKSKKQRKQPM